MFTLLNPEKAARKKEVVCSTLTDLFFRERTLIFLLFNFKQQQHQAFLVGQEEFQEC